MATTKIITSTKKPKEVLVSCIVFRIACREVSLKKRYAYKYVLVEIARNVDLEKPFPLTDVLSSKRQVLRSFSTIMRDFKHRNINLDKESNLHKFIGGAVFINGNEHAFLTKQQFRAIKTKFKILNLEKQVTVLY